MGILKVTIWGEEKDFKTGICNLYNKSKGKVLHKGAQGEKS